MSLRTRPISLAFWVTLAVLPWLLLALLPGPGAVRFCRGLWSGALAEATGHPARAVALYRPLVTSPGEPLEDGYLSVLRLAAARALDGGDAGRAVGYLSEADERLPGDLHTLVILGLARQRAGDPSGALEAFRRAAREHPEASDGLVAAANLLWIQGDRPAAEAAYAEARKRAPDSGLPLVEMAEAARWSGQSGRANELYQEAVQLEPGCATCRLHRARFLAAQGRDAEAEHEARTALLIQPTYAEARIFLAGRSEVEGLPSRSRFGRGRILFASQARRSESP